MITHSDHHSDHRWDFGTGFMCCSGQRKTCACIILGSRADVWKRLLWRAVVDPACCGTETRLLAQDTREDLDAAAPQQLAATRSPAVSLSLPSTVSKSAIAADKTRTSSHVKDRRGRYRRCTAKPFG